MAQQCLFLGSTQTVIPPWSVHHQGHRATGFPDEQFPRWEAPLVHFSFCFVMLYKGALPIFEVFS